MDLRGYIVILKKDGAPGPFCDWRADKCVFGSDPSCDVNINLTDIDPVHCTLQALQDGRVMAESHVKPTSRTLLNGEPVVSRTFVPHNSTLTVGERNFKFLYPENSTWISTFRQQSPRSTKKDAGFRSLTTPVVDVDSFPVVRSKSPKPSVPQPFVKRTPTASPARRPLTTRERYGPTPPRPITPAPVVEVKRHESRSSLKPRRSSIGSRNTPISPSLSRKKAKVLIVTNTPGPQSIRRTARQQKTLLSSQQTNNSSITSSYSMLGLKSPNYSSQSAYTAAFLDDPSYDASYDPSTADVLSPAAEYLSSQKKGNFAKFPFTEPRQRTYANRTPIPRRKSLPRDHPMLSPKGSDSCTPVPVRSRSTSSPASSSSFVRESNTVTSPASSNNSAMPSRYNRSSKSAPADKALSASMPSSPSHSHVAVKTPLTEKSGARGRSIASSTKFKLPPMEVTLHSGARRSQSLQRASFISPANGSSKKDSNAKQILKSKSKAVKFGPALSPEQFDSSLPPSTPVRRGAVPLMHNFRGRASVVSSPQYPSTAKDASLHLEETRRSLSAPATGVRPRSPARTKNILARRSPGAKGRRSTLSVSSPVHSRRSETRTETTLSMSSTGKSDLSIPNVSKSQDSFNELSSFSLVSPTQVVTETREASIRKRGSRSRTSTPQNVSKRLSASSSRRVSSTLKMNSPPSSLKRTNTPEVYSEGVSTVKSPRLSNRRAVTPSHTPRSPLRTSSPAVPESIISGTSSRVSRGRKSNQMLISQGPASPDDILMSQTPRTIPHTDRRSKSALKSGSRRSSSVSDLLDSATGRGISKLSVGTPVQANASPLTTLNVLSGPRASRGFSRLETPMSVRLSASVASTPLSFAEETLKSPTPRKSSRSSTKSRKSSAVKTPSSMIDARNLVSPVSSNAVDILLSPTPAKSKRPSVRSRTPNVLSATKSVNKLPLSATSLVHLRLSTSSLAKTPRSPQLISSHMRLSSTGRKSRTSIASESTSTQKSVRLSASSRRLETSTSASVSPRSVSRSSTVSAKVSGVHALTPQSVATTPNWSRTSDLSGVSTAAFSQPSLFHKSPSTRKKRRSQSYARVVRRGKTPASERRPRTSNIKNFLGNRRSRYSLSLSGVNEVLKSPVAPRTSKVSRASSAIKAPTPLASSAFTSAKKIERKQTPVAASSVRKTPRSVRSRPSWLTDHITPVATQKSKRISRLSTARGHLKTPKSQPSPRLTGVWELMKTPTPTQTPRISAAQKLVKTPKSRPSPRLTGVRKLMKTPRPERTPRISAVHKLLKTPKSQPSPRLAGVRSLLKTPKSQPSPRLSGVRELLNTPKTKPSPRVSAVRSLVKTPKSQRSPRISDVRASLKTPTPKRTPRTSAVRRPGKTPRSQSSPPLTSVRELVATPAAMQTPRVSAARRVVKTPGSQLSLRLTEAQALARTPTPKQTPITLAVRGLGKTPRSKQTPRLTDVHERLKTPTPKRTPRISAAQKLLKTPKSRPSPPLSAVRELMKTPRISAVYKLLKTPKSRPSPRLTGVRKLMKTPKPERTPRISAVHKLLKTPKSRPSPRLAGVRSLLKTPKSHPSPRLSGVQELLKTPSVARSSLSDTNVLTPAQFPDSIQTKSLKRSVRSLKRRKTPSAEANTNDSVLSESTKRPKLRRNRGLATQSPKSPLLKRLRSPAKSGSQRLTTSRRPTRAAKSRQTPKSLKRSALASVKATAELSTPAKLSSHPSPSSIVTLASRRRGRVANKTPAKTVSTPLTKASPKLVRSIRGRPAKVKPVEKTTEASVHETTPVSPPTRTVKPKRILRGKTRAVRGTVVASPAIKSPVTKPAIVVKRTAPKRAVGGRKKAAPAAASPIVVKVTPKRALRGKALSSPVVVSSKKPLNRRAVRTKASREKLPQTPTQLAKINSPVKNNLRLRTRGGAQQESVTKAEKKTRAAKSKIIDEPPKIDNLGSTTPKTTRTAGIRKRRLLTPSNVEEASPAKLPKKVDSTRAAVSKTKATSSTGKSSSSSRQPANVSRSKTAAVPKVVTPVSTRRTRSRKE